MTILGYIQDSQYSINIKHAMYVVMYSGYFTPKGSSDDERVMYAEDFVITNGVFIGGKSPEGFFTVKDIDDFVDSFYIALIGDTTPPKAFSKKVIELYKQATTKIK